MTGDPFHMMLPYGRVRFLSPSLFCSKWFIVTGLLSNLFPFQSPNLIFASPLFFFPAHLSYLITAFFGCAFLCFTSLALPSVRPANPSPPSLLFPTLYFYIRVYSLPPTFFLLSRPLRLYMSWVLCTISGTPLYSFV